MFGSPADRGEAGATMREPRRATGQALQYWDALRGARRYPTRAEAAEGPSPAVHAHLFVVVPDADGRNCRFADGGSELGKLCGADPYGRAVRSALPEEFRSRAVQWIETAFQLGRPLADSGSFPDASGAQVLYRAVFMPLSDDQRRVDSLLGAISFKRERHH